MTAFHFDTDATVRRLRDSLQTIEDFAALVPAQWTHAEPDPALAAGTWPAAMNIAHMIAYEENIAGPLLQSLADGGDGTQLHSTREFDFLGEATALAPQRIPALCARLRVAREQQIAIIEGMGDRLHTATTPAFAARNAGQPHSAAWVANKTLQHTWEHGNAILRIALFTPH